MNILSPQNPILASPDIIRLMLKKKTTDNSVMSLNSEVYLPSRLNLEQKIPVESLVTPWNSDLQGHRIARYGEGGLRFLNRSGNKVTYSKNIQDLNINLYPSILQQCMDRFYWCALRLDPFFSSSETNRYLCTLETLSDLIQKFFVSTEPPRLIPRVVWPNKKDCIQMLSETINHSNIKLQSFDGSCQITILDTIPSLIVKDDRGQIVIKEENNDKNEVLWSAFKYLTDYDYFSNDHNFTFNGITI